MDVIAEDYDALRIAAPLEGSHQIVPLSELAKRPQLGDRWICQPPDQSWCAFVEVITIGDTEVTLRVCEVMR